MQSSQETDLDTETDSAYDGGKKKTEQEDKTDVRREEVSHRGNVESQGEMGKENSGRESSERESCERRIKEILRQKTLKNDAESTPGRGRAELKETREAFESRSRRDGLLYAEVGRVAVALQVAPESSWNENAKAAAEKIAQYGFEVVVFTGEMQHNYKGVTETSVEGFAFRHAGNLTIFISSELDIDGMETAYHEVFHAARYTLLATDPAAQGKLIVRRSRDIGKGTGTLLSPTDRNLGDTYPDDLVMTMYKITGNENKGWDGTQIWIPNIKLPGNCVYYTGETV